MIVIVCYLIKQSRQHCQQKLPSRLLCVLTGNFRTDYWCQLVLC